MLSDNTASQKSEIRIGGLDRSDYLELLDQLGEEGIRIAPQDKEGDEHNELGTVTAIVIVSIVALVAIVVTDMKNSSQWRRKNTYERRLPDGTWERITLNEGGSRDTLGKPEQIEAAAKPFQSLFGLDIRKALTQSLSRSNDKSPEDASPEDEAKEDEANSYAGSKQ